MQVYVELALLENFCMDFTLLYAAKVAVKNRATFLRIALGAVFGACFAVCFPLFGLQGAWAVVVKILSGLVICLISAKPDGVKSYIKFAAAFLLLTALLGGALIGAFSLAGLGWEAGQGFILSSVPVGIPLFGALLLITGVKKLAQRLAKTKKNEVICRIYAGQSQAEVVGFFDSGNKVYHNGSPVGVIPAETAEKLVDESRIKEEVKIHTVAGSRKIKVFTADKIEIRSGEKTGTLSGVKLAISPNKINRAVLHCDFLEELNV